MSRQLRRRGNRAPPAYAGALCWPLGRSSGRAPGTRSRPPPPPSRGRNRSITRHSFRRHCEPGATFGPLGALPREPSRRRDPAGSSPHSVSVAGPRKLAWQEKQEWLFCFGLGRFSRAHGRSRAGRRDRRGVQDGGQVSERFGWGEHAVFCRRLRTRKQVEPHHAERGRAHRSGRWTWRCPPEGGGPAPCPRGSSSRWRAGPGPGCDGEEPGGGYAEVVLARSQGGGRSSSESAGDRPRPLRHGAHRAFGFGPRCSSKAHRRRSGRVGRSRDEARGGELGSSMTTGRYRFALRCMYGRNLDRIRAPVPLWRTAAGRLRVGGETCPGATGEAR